MEREAGYSGEYRRRMLERSGQLKEEAPAVSFFLIRFYICLALFLAFCLLDYTKARFYSVDSERVVAEIQEDGLKELDFSSVDLKEMAAGLLKSIHISEE